MAAPAHGWRPPDPTLAEELRAGRAIRLDNDERLMRIQVWSLSDPNGRRTLLDLLAVVPATQVESTFRQESDDGPIDVKVTILR